MRDAFPPPIVVWCKLFTRFVWVVDFVWEDCVWVFDAVGGIARKWLFCLCGVAWKNMVEMGGDGAYVPTCFALSRAHSTIF